MKFPKWNNTFFFTENFHLNEKLRDKMNSQVSVSSFKNV